MNVRRTLEYQELLRKSSDIRESKGYRLRIIRATATCCICCILLHLASQFPCLVSWPAPLSRLRNGTPVARSIKNHKDVGREWKGSKFHPWSNSSNKNQICLYMSLLMPRAFVASSGVKPFSRYAARKRMCLTYTSLTHYIWNTETMMFIYIYIIFSLT